MRVFAIIWMLFLPPIASAGGSWEQVTVERLTLLDSRDYELVVLPNPRETDSRDPYIGTCSRFIVNGGYSWIHSWRFPEFVSRESHEAAVAYLRQAHAERKAILLGWMGTATVFAVKRRIVHADASSSQNYRPQLGEEPRSPSGPGVPMPARGPVPFRDARVSDV